ncbi:ATP-dependent DNA helicase [Granulibacter bethesdensis]|uniref:ATP-dependent DNA helicase n=1 Tax=Granulibacter bethesdensis TaxID=364410 RepID=UPI000909FDB3|nr:ATP-dependent DNA helicase [Granulibacter bethesdensis]APH60520.1 ATP-dependent helicase, DinG family [Granulibacter bethesdensis]
MQSRPPSIIRQESSSQAGYAALVAGYGQAALIDPDGVLHQTSSARAAAMLRTLPPVLVIHAPATLNRLALHGHAVPCLDLLELFAFVLPGKTASPTPRGLALALDLPPPGPGLEEQVTSLSRLASNLLNRLQAGRMTPLNRDAAALAARMGQSGWAWAPYVMQALGQPDAPAQANALRIWNRLPEWEDLPPPPPPSSHPVSDAEARSRLRSILGTDAEQRPGQADYAGAASAAFAPRQSRGDPHLVLAEAGTGTGKTLGYIAPASLWAERNHGSVWISTYTRHLQRQIEGELARLFPDPVIRRQKTVLRKGRENYLCLLNFEDAVASVAGLAHTRTIPLALLARWALVTEDGDLQGGDLPGWLPELFGGGLLPALADRRGECIHAGCGHWKKCFVEHSIRRARGADLVVANHALVMAQAVWGGLDDTTVPTRYVFDEGHHVFDAADGAFSAILSGMETAELRRWLRGAEGGRSRARGLRRRLEELVADDPDLQAPLEAALTAATALPSQGWQMRLAEAAQDAQEHPDSSPGNILLPDLGGIEAGRQNPAEALLHLLRRQALARSNDKTELPRTAIEADLHPVLPELPDAAAVLDRALDRILQPLKTLRQRLADRLESESDTLDQPTRSRIEATCRSLGRRAIDPLSAWRTMLLAIQSPPPEAGLRPEHVHFIRLQRGDTGDRDVGLHRHWLDPTIPFTATLASPAHGLLITSATLRDGGMEDQAAAWEAAEAQVGAPHLPSPALRAALASPFDYATQTRAFIITDVGYELAALAAAYRTLFLAAGGGGLGLFTAITRLRAVHARIAPALEAEGIQVLAQHVDAMDNTTLVDVFRTEIDSCLLGTDAMRDGVDVPGRALRLVAFERVPWPRPDILHRERRIHLSGGMPSAYDERITRMRLRQAFGRLVRSASDRGVFVLLDRRTPSRLLSAFPPGVTVRRVGLAEAAAETADFLGIEHKNVMGADPFGI